MVRVRQIMIDESEFVEAATVDEIDLGKMKTVELKGIDILIANVEGQFYAVDDRCGHMNVRLSMGPLEGKILTCPMHKAKFDVTTGRIVKLPEPESLKGTEKLPEDIQKFLLYTKTLVDEVKTYDMQTHEVKIEGNKIYVKI
jgi:nitrite reductase/ring-hydroxylating ferredoxin subunit